MYKGNLLQAGAEGATTRETLRPQDRKLRRLWKAGRHGPTDGEIPLRPVFAPASGANLSGIRDRAGSTRHTGAPIIIARTRWLMTR